MKSGNNETHAIWITSFPWPNSNLEVKAALEMAYVGHLRKLGHAVTDGVTFCVFKATEEEVAARRARMAEPSMVGAVQITYDVVDIAWAPEGSRRGDIPSPAGSALPPAVAASPARPRFGAQVVAIDATLARALDRSPASGAYVAQIFPGSPAENAGLYPADVIIEVASNPIVAGDDLSRAIAAAPAGPVTLKVWRNGAVKLLTARIDGALAAADMPTFGKADLPPPRPGACWGSVFDNEDPKAPPVVAGPWQIARVDDGAAADRMLRQFIDYVRSTKPTLSTLPPDVVGCYGSEGQNFCSRASKDPKRGIHARISCGVNAEEVAEMVQIGDRVYWRPHPGA